MIPRQDVPLDDIATAIRLMRAMDAQQSNIPYGNDVIASPDTKGDPKARTTRAVSSGVPANLISGSEPPLPSGSSIPDISPPPGSSSVYNGPVNLDYTTGSGSPANLLPSGVGPNPFIDGPVVQVPHDQPNYLPGGPVNLPTQGQIDNAGGDVSPQGGGYPVPFDPNNMGPITTTGGGFNPYRFGGRILGGVAGAYFGGPIGAQVGSRVGNYIGGIVSGDVPPRRYDPNAPNSLTNAAPIGPNGENAVQAIPGGGNNAYQQSGDIMDTSRGGLDPNTIMFTNGIRAFGPGSGKNQSSGYYGAGISQGDAMAQAALMARVNP